MAFDIPASDLLDLLFPLAFLLLTTSVVQEVGLDRGWWDLCAPTILLGLCMG